MASLLNVARAFVGCFIAFLMLFSIVFWEEHRHEWVLYVILLIGAAIAVWFFNYVREIETPDIRIRYSWHARRLHYMLFLVGFLSMLFVVFLMASIIQHAKINVEEELAELGAPILVTASILLVLLMVSCVLAWRASSMHWDVLTQHSCIEEQKHYDEQHLRISDRLWMVPLDTAPHGAEDVTHIAAANILQRVE